MDAGYVPERNDIVWPDFEPTRGKEIGKYRPALWLHLPVVRPRADPAPDQWLHPIRMIAQQPVGDVANGVE